MSNTVTAWFDQYSENCIPASVGPMVRREMEHAFYAGAFVMLQNVNKDDSNRTLAAAVAIRDSLEEEMREFFYRYNQRRADAYLTPFVPGNA